MGYVFKPIGAECGECAIEDCEFCYYDLGNGSSTLDFDFAPTDGTGATQKCRRCKEGYVLSSDFTTCDLTAITLENCR